MASNVGCMEPNPATRVESKSIFTSRTFAGIALILAPILLDLIGVKMDDAQTQLLVQDGFQLAGAIMAIWGRIKANRPVHFIKPPSAGVSVLLAFAVSAGLILTACSSASRSGRVTNAVLMTVGKFAGRVVLSSVANAANEKMAGRTIDMSHSLSAGLYANSESAITSDDISRIVAAWSGGAVPAQPLAGEFEGLGTLSAADRKAVVSAMAKGISDAALKLDGERSDAKAVKPLGVLKRRGAETRRGMMAGSVLDHRTSLGVVLRVPFRLDVDRIEDGTNRSYRTDGTYRPEEESGRDAASTATGSGVNFRNAAVALR